jgi:hypothetical protein
MKLPAGEVTRRRSSQGSDQAVQQVCQSVGAILSDGPDPDADPVGYAEAQVMPLTAIHTSDKPLQTAIDDLASAYGLFFRAKGDAAAKSAVTQASTRLNAICTGVAS